MKANSPRQVIEIIDKAFKEADIDTLVGMYDKEAVQIRYMQGQDMGEARGHAEIRSLYESLLKPGMFDVEQIRENVVETDGIALFMARWCITSEGKPPVEYISTVVLRQQADGSWKDLIDTGPSVLEG